MATIKIKIHVTELDNVMTEFDKIKVYRSDTTDEDGTYSEITTALTRIDLVAGTTLYEYIDTTAPSQLYWYKTSYFNSSNSNESSQSPAIQGSDPGLYVTLQNIRDEGLAETELSNERALALSYGWQAWFEHETGQFFTKKSLTLDLDGNGSRVLWLPFPVVEVTELYVNDDFTNEVDSTKYTVYNRYRPDDRRNPRIKLKRETRSIFERTEILEFYAGDLNQRIVGVFGYVEEDGSTPFLVQKAILSLVLLTAELKTDSEIDQLRAGRAIEEVTDRHRIRYSNLWDEISIWSPTGITEVDRALATYRRTAHVDMARSFAV